MHNERFVYKYFSGAHLPAYPMNGFDHHFDRLGRRELGYAMAQIEDMARPFCRHAERLQDLFDFSPDLASVGKQDHRIEIPLQCDASAYP